MSFPINPYTGQTTIVNSVNYIYDGTNNAWKRIPTNLTNLVISNTITTANLTVTGNITTLGNITANYMLGDGSQLTNLPVTGASTGKAIAMAIVFGG